MEGVYIGIVRLRLVGFRIGIIGRWFGDVYIGSIGTKLGGVYIGINRLRPVGF